ncbi:MAG: glycosyltransferase [Clostridiales bacterium]|nr:glycosyltransferase [Clostridiales bacterium]
MANFLFISRVMNDEGNANTQCLLKLSERFSKDGHRCFFVADDLYGNDDPPDKDHRTKLRIRCKRIHKSIDAKLAAKGRKSAAGAFWYLMAVFLTYVELWLYMDQLTANGRKLIRKEKIDYIVSVFQDLENHRVAFRLTGRKRRPKWIMYNLDQLSFNDAYNDKQKENFRKMEKIFAKRAYGLINSEGMEEEYVKNDFMPYKDIPRIEVPLPNLIPHTDENSADHNGKTILRYFGNFYKNIRNPDMLIKMISDLDPQKYRVEFYGSGCEYLSNSYEQLPPCVYLMGSVDHDECIRLTADADVLINLGNTCANQMPSKVFEYIGSGKPILNFYFNENECSMKYLLSYPRILNVRYDQKVSGDELDEFLRNAEKIPEEEIRKIYSDVLSDSVVKKISDFILNER